MALYTTKRDAVLDSLTVTSNLVLPIFSDLPINAPEGGIVMVQNTHELFIGTCGEWVPLACVAECIDAPTPILTQDDPHPEPKIAWAFDGNCFKFWGRVRFPLASLSQLLTNASLQVEVTSEDITMHTTDVCRVIDPACSRGLWTSCIRPEIPFPPDPVMPGQGECCSGPVFIRQEGDSVFLVFRNCYDFPEDTDPPTFLILDFLLNGMLVSDEPVIPLLSLRSFETLNAFDSLEGTPSAGLAVTPPDPNCAVGPDDYIQCVNSQMSIYNKITLQQKAQFSLDVFFGVPAPFAGHFIADPWIVYDHHEDRFVLVVLEVDFTVPDSNLFVAISKASTFSNPPLASDWWIYEISSPYTGFIPDYPKLGYDADAYYLTAVRFSFASVLQGEQIVALRKSDVLNGPSSPPEPPILYNSGNIPGFGPLSAAAMYTPTGDMYFISNQFSGVTRNTIIVSRLSNILGVPTLTHFTLPVATYRNPTVNIIQPPPPALGLETVGDRFMSCVVRHGRLWAAHNIRLLVAPPTNPNRTVVRWYEIDITTSTPTLVQSGDVVPTDPTDHTWMSHIDVNVLDQMGLVFSIAGINRYASIGITGRVPSDPPGTTRKIQIVRDGEQTMAFGPRNRWGDYAGLAIDPVDDTTFWYNHEYVPSLRSLIPFNPGLWATQGGSFVFALSECEEGMSTLLSKGVSSSLSKGVSSSLSRGIPPKALSQKKKKANLQKSLPEDIVGGEEDSSTIQMTLSEMHPISLELLPEP